MARIVVIAGRALSPGSSWGDALGEMELDGHQVVGVASTQGEGNRDWSAGFTVPNIPLRLDGQFMRQPRSQILPRKVVGALREGKFLREHLVLLSMLSRYDKSGTFRLQDREVVARKIYAQVEGFLNETQPELIVFEETPHEPVAYGLFSVASLFGIPRLYFQPTVLGPLMIAKTEINGEARSLHFSQDIHSEKAFAATLQLSNEAIQRLFSGEGTLQQTALETTPEAQGGVAMFFAAAARATREVISGRELWPTSLTSLGPSQSPMRRLIETVLRRWTERKQRRFLDSWDRWPSELETLEGFAVFFLHHEPERTSLPEGYPFYTQLDAVLHASSLLPDTFGLVVKEHPAQVSRSRAGYSARGPMFYEALQSIPRVYVIPSDSDSKRLLREANLVFTLNGNVAFEAFAHGTPTVSLGSPWWRGMPGTYDTDGLARSQELPTKFTPDFQEIQIWLNNMIKDKMIPGIGGRQPEFYARRIAKLPPGFQSLETRALCLAVRDCLQEAADDAAGR